MHVGQPSGASGPVFLIIEGELVPLAWYSGKVVTLLLLPKPIRHLIGFTRFHIFLCTLHPLLAVYLLYMIRESVCVKWLLCNCHVNNAR